LPKDLVLVGYPVVHLWVTSSHPDGDFFVYLEEVDAEGSSHYVTEGGLRASHRALSSPPYESFGLPYHRSFREDLADLPDEPVELVFDLLGTAILIDAGHRIRVTVTGADAANHELYPDPGAGAPTISIHRNTTHQSYIELPEFR
jgi:putative CocE/NonD family hydrolase